MMWNIIKRIKRIIGVSKANPRSPLKFLFFVFLVSGGLRSIIKSIIGERVRGGLRFFGFFLKLEMIKHGHPSSMSHGRTYAATIFVKTSEAGFASLDWKWSWDTTMGYSMMEVKKSSNMFP